MIKIVLKHPNGNIVRKATIDLKETGGNIPDVIRWNKVCYTCNNAQTSPDGLVFVMAITIELYD